jgi:hypothetical protein
VEQALPGSTKETDERSLLNMSDRPNPRMSTHSSHEPVPNYIRTDRQTPRFVAWMLLILSIGVFAFSMHLMQQTPAKPKVIHVPTNNFDDDDDDELPNMTLVSGEQPLAFTEVRR